MSYEAEALADGPAIYIRTNEVGTDTNGATWPDYSGNGLDATQVYAPLFGGGPTGIARGYPSVIETDGDAREFYGWTNPLSPLEGTSQLIVGDDAAMQPSTDFTLIAHVRPEAGMYAAVSIFLVGKVNSCAISFEFVSGGQRLAGYCFDTAGTKWTVADTSFEVDDFIGDSFFVALRRIGPSLSLFINRTLRGTTSITSGLGTAAGGDFIIGHSSSLHFTQCKYADPRLYLTGLSADRLLAQYEETFFNNPLFGRADLRMIATLDGDAEPTPQLFPFSPNWENPPRESLTWSTDVLPAGVDYEQRAAIRQRPTRSLEFDSFIGDNQLRRRFHAYLFQNQRRTIYLGDWTEAAALTANAPNGSTSAAFVSAGRGFENGGLMAIYQDETNFEIVEIDTVGSTSTTLANPTANDWSKGTARAVPVVRAVIADQLDFDRHTDQLEETTITFRVLAQDVPLEPRRNGTYTPRYIYKGIEVFDPFILGTNNWNDTGRGQISLRTVDPESPAGIFSRSPLDSASREILSYNFFLDSRADISRFLAWAWSIQGRRVPVWVPTLQEDFTALASDNFLGYSELTVAGHEYSDFYQVHPARRDLVLIHTDETMVFRRITAVEEDEDDDVLTLEGAAPSLANLIAVSFLKLSRLQEDTIGLVWHTDELVEVTLNFVDLLTSPE